jgi:hypothetical protein
MSKAPYRVIRQKDTDRNFHYFHWDVIDVDGMFVCRTYTEEQSIDVLTALNAVEEVGKYFKQLLFVSERNMNNNMIEFVE